MDIHNSHKAHPWHGIDLGDNVPEEVRAFIEIVPTDTVKYEVDKESGYLSLDRPQKFSNIVPSLYGFLPKTYCSAKMAELSNQALARYDIEVTVIRSISVSLLKRMLRTEISSSGPGLSAGFVFSTTTRLTTRSSLS